MCSSSPPVNRERRFHVRISTGPSGQTPASATRFSPIAFPTGKSDGDDRTGPLGIGETERDLHACQASECRGRIRADQRIPAPTLIRNVSMPSGRAFLELTRGNPGQALKLVDFRNEKASGVSLWPQPAKRRKGERPTRTSLPPGQMPTRTSRFSGWHYPNMPA